jgi:hypothetical protein
MIKARCVLAFGLEVGLGLPLVLLMIGLLLAFSSSPRFLPGADRIAVWVPAHLLTGVLFACCWLRGERWADFNCYGLAEYWPTKQPLNHRHLIP